MAPHWRYETRLVRVAVTTGLYSPAAEAAFCPIAPAAPAAKPYRLLLSIRPARERDRDARMMSAASAQRTLVQALIAKSA